MNFVSRDENTKYYSKTAFSPAHLAHLLTSHFTTNPPKMNFPPILSSAETRKIDQIATETYGIPGLILMENAGRGIADVLCGRGIHGPVLIFCGTGNNAGDGMVIARQLSTRGFFPHIFLCAAPEKFRGDARTQYDILAKMTLPMTPLYDIPPAKITETLQSFLENADWLIDALLGTGAKGAPRPPMDEIIRIMNAAGASGKRILAVDLPSGLDADTGIAAEPCVRANLTCTLSAVKIGLNHPDAQKFTGEIILCDIGFPVSLVNFSETENVSF